MSHDSTIKIGIIGAGAFARFSIAAYRRFLPGTHIQAITSRTLSRAEAVAMDFGIPEVLPDNESLLRHDDLDVVIILTPPQTHYDLAAAALEYGRHVLVDKPIAFTADQARNLTDTAAASGLKMATNLVLRVHRFNRRIRGLRRDKTYGRLLQIVSTGFLARYPQNHWYWDQNVSGGFFLNTFSHFVDLFDYIVGETPDHVASNGDAQHGYILTGTYPGGVTATLVASLQVSNEHESCRNAYIFESGVVETEGWLPERIHIRPEKEEPEILQSNPKLDEYQDCLAQILFDLMERIRHPEQETATAITMDVIRDSVVLPLLYQNNEF